MHLTPREQEKLLIVVAAMWRAPYGSRLKFELSEAIAIITAELMKCA